MEAQMGLKQPNKNSNVVAITVPDFNLYNKPTVKKKKNSLHGTGTKKDI
jgi:hypothetical protein